MVSIFGIAKRGFGMLKKKKKGKEWDILKKHPTLAKQSYSKSAVNKMLSKDFKKKKPKTMDDLMDKVSEDYIKYRKKKK